MGRTTITTRCLALLALMVGLGAAHPTFAQTTPYTTPLATGVRLDPAGRSIDLGSMPMGMVLAPGGERVVIVLSGWREQGIQVVDTRSMRVTQTIEQEAAFYGLAFSPDGQTLYVSGGNEDAVFCYAWKDGTATLQRKIVLGKQKEDKTGSRYPAGLAVSKNGKLLYVIENAGDSLAVVDLATSEVVQRFPTDHYPYAVEVASDQNVYVSAWGGETISILRARPDGMLSYRGRLKVGRHPSAMRASASGTRLFVALAGSDQIAVVDTRTRKVTGTLSDAAPAGPSEGSTPNALTLSADGSRLFVAEGDNNAVAVFDVSPSRPNRLLGRVPSDWYPTAVLVSGKQLLILNGKGHGSRPNPDGPTPGEGIKRRLGYTFGAISGTLRVSSSELDASTLAGFSRRVAAANNWGGPRSPRHYPPFKHVVYVLKENRTYDQLFGDLKEGDGDPSLVFFGRTVAPNHRGLALRFGLFDRFFTNAEVSSQGHVWSMAAYVTDYDEKLVQSGYGGKRGSMDGEEANEPAAGFLWSLAARSGVTFRDYGEMVKSGDDAWPVTQRDLGSDIDPDYPGFDLHIPDQKRADVWIGKLKQFVADGNMPQLQILWLPADHTAGGKAGFRTPRAYMADNDLALGRMVEALSRSPFWTDTVMFVLEDDAQAGPDHVDSHRSPLLAISAYSRPGTIHRFANTTDVIAAIEDILHMGQLSKFDYFSRPLSDIFASTPDPTPYHAIVPETDLNEMNPEKSAAAIRSEGLDFSKPDGVNDAVFNQLLWSMLKGDEPEPAVETKDPLHLMEISK